MDIHAAKTVAIAVLAFLVCYFPPILFRVWGRLRSNESWWPEFLAHFFIFISSGTNPIIYCFRTRRFRSALKQLLKDPCGRSPFQETNQVQMAQRSIPRKISRQAAENNRIADEAAEARLAPRVHIAVEGQARCSTAAFGERGLELQHVKEAETAKSNSQSSGPRKRSNTVPLHHQETGRVKLACTENHHRDSADANSSSGEESLVVCRDLNTQQQVTAEVHPVPKTITVCREATDEAIK